MYYTKMHDTRDKDFSKILLHTGRWMYHMMTRNNVVSESPKPVTVALTTIELETHGALGHIV